MKKFSAFVGVLSLLILASLLTFSCQLGLGSAIDIASPTVAITSPKDSAVIRGEFALLGTWSDDGLLDKVSVVLNSTTNSSLKYEFNGEFTGNSQSEAKNWKAVINPLSAEKPIKDGEYKATVSVFDTAGHETKVTKTFTIDNTVPVIVLQRPGTKIESSDADSYGQTFTLEGQGADANNIDHIDVHIYSDKDCLNFLKTVTLNNVPLNIKLDVASFKEEAYTAIYGSEEKEGEKQLYCKIDAYDSAQKYPTDFGKNQSADDTKGNKTSTYYLYDELASDVLSKYNVARLYEMMNGTYTIPEKDKQTVTQTPQQIMEIVKSVLEGRVVKVGTFTLNPENNPKFTLNGKDALLAEGLNLENEDLGYFITNGSDMNIEVTPGLDGTVIVNTTERPLKVYVEECDAAGKVLPTAKRIYPALANVEHPIRTSGSTYKIYINLNVETAFSADSTQTLKIGGMYRFGVEGEDLNGNEIIPSAETGFGFYLASSGRAPELKVTSPLDSTIYKKGGDGLTVEGYSLASEGVPTVKVFVGESETPVWQKKFTEAEGVQISPDSAKKRYNFVAEVPRTAFSQSEEKDYSIEITASISDKSVSVTKTLWYDLTAPEIDFTNISPVIETYEFASDIDKVAASDNINTDGTFKRPFINGKIRFRGTVQDTLTKIKSVEWRVIQNDVTVPGIGGSLGTSFNFEFDTAATGITDNRNITVSFVATDSSGNTQTVNKEYFVCQNTDKPVSGPNNPNAWTAQAQQPKQIRDGVFGTHSNKISAGSSIYTKVTDDDGIKSVSFKVEKLGYNSSYEDCYVLPAADQSSIPADIREETLSNLGSPVETIVSHSMPTSSGYFKVTITVLDLNDKSTLKSFVVQMTGAAPDVTVATKSDYIKTGNNVELEVTMIGEAPFTIVVLQNDGSADWHAGTPITVTSSALTDNKTTIHVTPIPSPVNQTIRVRVTDNSSGQTTKDTSYKVDNTVPANPVIESPAAGSTGNNSLGGSAFVFSGKANDAVAPAGETSSGIKKLWFAFTDSDSTPTSWTEQTASSGTWNINATLLTGTGSSSGTTLYEGKYYLHVKSEDGAGNQSNPTFRSFTVDQAAPSITDVKLNNTESLASGTVKYFKTDSGDFTISGTLTETHGIESLEVNGATVTTTAGAAGTYTWTHTITRALNSQIDLSVAATDKAGRITSHNYSIYCDTQAPTLSITNPDTDLEGGSSLSSTSYTFRGSVSDSGSGVDTFIYKFSQEVFAADAEIISNAETGTGWSSNVSGSSFIATKDLIEGTTTSAGKLHEGKWYLYSYAVDKMGTKAVEKRLFWVDKKAPTLTLGNLPSATNSTVAVKGTASDDNGIKDVVVNITSTESPFSAITDTLTDVQYAAGKTYTVGSGNDLPDGTYTIEVTATDNAGKTATKTVTVLVDTAAPGGTVEVDSATATPVVIDGKNWYNKESLKVKFVQSSDTGSEIEEVKARFRKAGTSETGGLEDLVKKTSGSNTWWEGSLPVAAQGENEIYLTVKDKAGNTGTLENPNTPYVYIDTQSPDEFAVYNFVADGTDYSTETAITSSATINGKSAKTFVIVAQDKDDEPGTFTGIKEVAYLYGSGTNDKILAVVLSAQNHTYKVTVPANIPGTQYQRGGTVRFSLTDKAGNSTSQAAFSFILDETPPTVEINAVTDAWTALNGDTTASIDVNGVLNLSGTAGDNLKIKANGVTVKYAVGIAEPSDWNAVSTTVAASGTTSWTASIDTTALSDATNLYIKAFATDEAGNVGESITKTLYINQDSDRPIITFSNLDLSQSTIWLKGIKNAYGSVFDDDGNITKLEYKIGSGGTYTEIAVTNGSWNQEMNDGQNEVYFKITDAKGKVFETGTSTKPKLKSVSGSTATIVDGVLTVKVDNATPKFTNIRYDSRKPDGSTFGYTTDITTLKFGGEYTKLFAKLNAFDENGVKSVTLELGGTVHSAEIEGATEEIRTANKNSSESKEWSFAAEGITIPDNLTGTKQIKFLITDQADLTREENVNIVIDNTKPVLSFTSHTDGSTVFATAEVSVRGSVDSNDLAEWYYAITNTPTAPDTGNSAYKPLVKNESSTSFEIVFDNGVDTATQTHAPKLFNQILTLEGIAQSVLEADDTVRNLYIHVYGKDDAGNESLKKTLHLKAIPNGDKPTVSFSYPAASGASLGGTIRVTGSSAIQQSEVDGVYIQIDPSPSLVWTKSANGSHYLNGSVYTKYTGNRYKYEGGTYSLAAGGAYVLIGGDYFPASDVLYYVTGAAFTSQWDTNLSAVEGGTPKYTRQTVTYTGGSTTAIKTGGNVASWNVTLNAQNEFNNDVKAIALKIFAVSKTGKKSDEQTIWFRMDPDAPQIGSTNPIELVKRAGDLHDGAIIARRNYEANMWIQGRWYLVGSVKDDSGIQNIVFKDGSQIHTLVEITDQEGNVGAVTNPAYATWLIQGTAHGSNYDYELNIPVGSTEANRFGSLSYEISAMEGSEQRLSTKQTIVLNYDNKAPDFAATTSAVLSKTTWAEKLATELGGTTEIQNSNSTYGFYGIVQEESDAGGNQSGFSRVALYFTRTRADGNKYIIDPMRTGGSGGTENFIETSANFETYSSVQNGGDGLYWLKARSFTVTESNILTANDTSTPLHESVRRGGLVKVNGAIYVINSVDIAARKITVKGSMKDGSVDVYFAVCQVVDNFTSEGGTTAAYNPSITLDPTTNDDGDQMIEAVIESGTMYTWKAFIDSRLILDGDVTLHFVAFDKAGNTTEKTYSATVKNNAPRLYGVKYGTDVNGDGTISQDEYITTFHEKYSVLSGGTTYYGYSGSIDNPVTRIEAAERLTVKTDLHVVPRVVGGNMGLGYTYTYKQDPAQSATTTEPFQDYSVGHATDLRPDALGITLAQKDVFLTKNIKDGDQSITFNLWDKTDNTNAGTDSYSAEIVIPVKVAVQDNEVPVVYFDPFKWVSASDNSLYANSKKNGHIELEADLPTATFTVGGTGVYDRDAKVSGKITFVGKVTDNVVVKEIKVKIPNYNGGTAFTIATRNASGALTSTNMLTLGGTGNKTYADYDFASTAWYFEILEEGDRYEADGSNTVEFKFHFDTSRITGVAQTDVGIELTASDRGKAWINTGGVVAYNPNTSEAGTVQTTAAAKTGYYKVDVVPYITGIETGIRSKGGLKNNNIRSASGKYSVMKVNDASFITVKGFNLNPASVRIVSSSVIANATASSGIAVTYSAVNSEYASFSANANLTKSGYMEVFVNGVRTLNNINSNDSRGSFVGINNVEDYKDMPNREADYNETRNVTLNDDRYIRLFDMKKTNTKNGYYPVMIMDGDNPVFGFVDSSGRHSADASINMSYPADMQPQRRKFNSDGTYSVGNTEYLVSGTTFDQMAMAKDEGGRYHQVSVYNRNAASMGYYYEKFASLHTNSAGGYDGRQMGSGYQYYTPTWSQDANNNALTLDGINAGGAMIDRYQSIKLLATGNSTNATGAYIYQAYYDDSTSELIFRQFRVRSTGGTGWKQLYTGYGYTNLTENNSASAYAQGRNVAVPTSDGMHASKYYDFGIVTKNGNKYAVFVYYDFVDGRLKIRYTTTALDGSPTQSLTWANSSMELPPYVGQYVSMTIVGEALHIAAFDQNNSDLVYIYVPNYSGDNYTAMTVDAAGSVGQWTSIKVRDNKPYIAYYNSTETGGHDAVKLAYANATLGNVEPGINPDTNYTSTGWEYMTVPSVDPAQGGSQKFQAVCLDFDSTGRPVVGYLGTNLEFGKWIDE